MTEEQEVEYFEKLLIVAKTKLYDFNSRKQLLSKKYRKKVKVQQALIDSQIKKQAKVE